MKCEDCEFWVTRETQPDGECRRNPPQCLLVPMLKNVLNKTGQQGVGVGVQSFFPRTKGEVYCGEFKMRQQ